MVLAQFVAELVYLAQLVYVHCESSLLSQFKVAVLAEHEAPLDCGICCWSWHRRGDWLGRRPWKTFALVWDEMDGAVFAVEFPAFLLGYAELAELLSAPHAVALEVALVCRAPHITSPGLRSLQL
jgi:hypothetical protein